MDRNKMRGRPGKPTPREESTPVYREHCSAGVVQQPSPWLADALTASLEALLSPDATLCQHLVPGSQLVVAAWLPGVATCARFECAAIFENVGADDRCWVTCVPLGVNPLSLSSSFFAFTAGVCGDCLELEVATIVSAGAR